ncbi:MAG: hypothetical protein ACI97A_001752 [Planctomycetota bacterium]|jgi:hypothetical protein
MRLFSSSLVVLALGAVLLLSRTSQGQLLSRFVVHGDSQSDLLGNSVGAFGDANGDGLGDVWVEVPGDGNGSTQILSGLDGSLIYKLVDPCNAGFLPGVVSGLSDVNGDGIGDFIAGKPFNVNSGGLTTGVACVYSGIDGAILYSLEGNIPGDQFGFAVSGAGHVNNDGVEDFIIGVRFGSSNGLSSGSARVFSGIDGSLLHSFDGDGTNDQFGSSVSGAGDVNNDGFDDVIVGATFDDNNFDASGSVRVFSGLDGSILYTRNGDAIGDLLGNAVCGLGDTNGDGFAEFCAGAASGNGSGAFSGFVRIYSGVDGSVLATVDGAIAGDRFGTSMANAGDINQDGISDLIIGAPDASFSGSATVVSGLDGSLIQLFLGSGSGSDFGRTVSSAGDVNGDGRADIIVGDTLSDVNGTNSGSVHVFAAEIAPSFCPVGTAANNQFGVHVSTAGDVNDDGFDDVIVGAHLADTNGIDAGHARVISGVDGTVLHSLSGIKPGDHFGRVVGAAGDINGDGFADVIVGASEDDNNGLNAGSALIFSGVDGTILFTFNGGSDGDFLGFCVGGAGDVNGDGHDDVIAGAYGDDDNGLDCGSATVYSGADGSILHLILGANSGDEFGRAVDGAGDANGDGFADFIVGAHLEDTNGVDAGAATIYSGADGSVLNSFLGDNAGDGFGRSVSGAGDFNGDGFADVVIGAHLDDNNGVDAGSVRVISGFDGVTIYTFNGQDAGDNFGFSASGAGDIDGDDVDDLIVGAFQDDNAGAESGSAKIYRSTFTQTPITLGQIPQPGLAIFDINNATNSRGFATDSGVVNSAARGPYASSVAVGGTITFSWSGVPFSGLFCLFGPANDAVVLFPGVGQLDIGGPPFVGGLPSLLFVFGSYLETATSFHHSQFYCGANGQGFVSYQLSPVYVPGYLTRFQCAMNPSGSFYISNAVDLTIE